MLMSTLLTAAAISAMPPMMSLGDHEFRLSVAISPRSDDLCLATPDAQHCGKRGDPQSRWRVMQDVTVLEPPSRLHLSALRLQPARCVNPAEDGLRCIKPVAFARISLDDRAWRSSP